MSVLATDFAFDFCFPTASIEPPSTPPDMSLSMDSDSPYLSLPYSHHARSSSRGSAYSAVSAISSAIESTPDSVCTGLTTPPRASSPIRQHGPLLLPKIRSQDQEIDAPGGPVAFYQAALHRRVKATSSTPPPRAPRAVSSAPSGPRRPFRSSHIRSYTETDVLSSMAYAHMNFSSQPEGHHHIVPSASLLCSPATFAQDGTAAMSSRRASTCSSVDVTAAMEKYGYAPYQATPFAVPAASAQVEFNFPSSYTPREMSPLSVSATPEPVASTTLLTFLTTPNPAASLVRSVSFPMRDPNTKHFWWDVRSLRSWTGFNASAVLSLPGASGLLNAPVPTALLSQPSLGARHPETEAALHSIYASFYLPKLNSALAISSRRPLQLSVPTRHAPNSAAGSDFLFVGHAAGESSTAAAAMFGGKPSARVVGIVRSFDRFNTGMRVESNIKRVEYLRGLAALHHQMREHSCRYGFIITEIELVLVRNGTDSTPFFGDLEVATVQLAASSPEGDLAGAAHEMAADTPLTACLALWGLCQMASDDPPAGHPYWRAEIGAPAEGTRRKAMPREKWMPQPQLAEKRQAKRARGWVWPEDAIGRKELGKRGVKYGGI